jgi:hypothetical protein
MRYRVIVAVHGGGGVKATVHSPQTLGIITHLRTVGLAELEDAATGRLYLAVFDADGTEDAGERLRLAIRVSDPRPVKGLDNLVDCAADRLEAAALRRMLWLERDARRSPA